MPRRQKTRHKRRPPPPGPVTCSPWAAKKRTSTRKCLPKSIIHKIAASLKNPKGTEAALAQQLGCIVGDERCIVEKSPLSYREKKHLLMTFFRPTMPEGWKADPDMWLNSEDIANVMKQYEKAFPEFRFLGVVPIDFSAPDPYSKGSSGEKRCISDQFCHVNLKEEEDKGRRILGAVFNLDPSYKGGSHWVALAIDLVKKSVYYFDSYGIEPPKQIAHFMRHLLLKDPNLKLMSNGRRFQYSNTECGMYSLYFLIRMIAGEDFKKFCRNPIADKYMLQFRQVLFDPK